MANMTGAAVQSDAESDSLFSDDDMLNRSYSKNTICVLRTSGSSDSESKDDMDRFRATHGRKPMKNKRTVRVLRSFSLIRVRSLLERYWSLFQVLWQ